jgi:hypothetical protein
VKSLSLLFHAMKNGIAHEVDQAPDEIRLLFVQDANLISLQLKLDLTPQFSS